MPQRIEFRHRAHEVSRLEAFSDVIFGFAVTLLVVSLEAPKTYGELIEMMHGVLPFAVCFLIFVDFWSEHHKFFRRYALHDKTVMMLNTLLLFVVLFYVYPLKYVFTMFLNGMAGQLRETIDATKATNLFTIYGVGFTALFWTLGALYAHAYRHRDDLELNDVEQLDTRESMWDNFTSGAIGVLSIVIAQTRYPGLAGWTYMLLAIPKTLVPTMFGRKRRSVEQQMVRVAASPA
jgi:uncharacterized membrane protein